MFKIRETTILETKMIAKMQLVLPVCLMAAVVFCATGSTETFVSNISEACYRCLCHVSTKCDTSHGCTAGYCGPFNISRVYWVDAGKVNLPEDDPERNQSWEDCAKNYQCARRIVEGYLTKFGKDCNNDGITDCFDYMMVNGNGGYNCTAPLNRTVKGREWLQRYEECKMTL